MCEGEARVDGAEWADVISSLGGFGGFGEKAAAELDRISGAVGSERLGELEAGGGDVAGHCRIRGGAGAPDLLFTCNMLQRAGPGVSEAVGLDHSRTRWVSMSCEEVDDYEALRELGGRHSDLKQGDGFVLLRGDEEDRGPLGGDWFIRHGCVEAAGAALRSLSKVGVRVFAHERWGPEVTKLHLSHYLREERPCGS